MTTSEIERYDPSCRLVGRSRTGIGLFGGIHGHSGDSGATSGGLGGRCADNEGRTGRRERRRHKTAPPRSPESPGAARQGGGQARNTEKTESKKESFPRSRDVTPHPPGTKVPPSRADALAHRRL